MRKLRMCRTLAISTMWDAKRAAGLVLLGFLMCAPVSGQDRMLPDHDPRVREAARVYDLLVRAIQIPATAPRLFLYDGKKYAAQTFADHRIVLDRRLFELTRALGADSSRALAFILGHELHHAISDDFWCHQISASRAVIDTRTRDVIRRNDATRNPEQQVIAESRADAIGALYAYLAGFGGEIPVERILQSIYEEYRPTSVGYPPFAQRLQIIRTTHERVQQLLPLFDAANRWVLIGENALAAEVYTRLLQDFPSREVYNNQGVTRALHAMAQLSLPPTIVFPFEVDMDSRARTSVTRGGESGDAEYWLRQARESFQEATRRDTGYVTAWLNLACVEALLADHGDHSLALGIASTARKMSARNGTPRSVAAALGVQGIIHRLHGEDRRGESLLRDAENAWPGLPFVRRNLALERGSAGLKRARPEPGQSDGPKEHIAGVYPDEPPAMISRPLFEEARILWASREEVPYRCVSFRDLDDDARDLVILATMPGYSGATARGVRLGSALTALQSSYGSADAVMHTPNGTVHRFTEERIAFFLDNTDHVTEWMIW